MATVTEAPQRVLIFLLGSLGDTLVALPALHLLARRFPDAERRILTHSGVNPKAISMSSLLDGSGLVHGYFTFAPQSKRAANMWALIRQIRAWKPDLVVHLHEPRGRLNAVRDLLFFRACGARAVVGLPLSHDLQLPRYLPKDGRFEHRCESIARGIAALGDLRLESPDSWSLGLSEAERQRGAAAVAALRDCRGVIAFSIGTKFDVNDWEDGNWRGLLRQLGRRLPGYGLVAVGALVERARTGELLAEWPGPALNLCGSLAVRESAAVLGDCAVYVGHDSGPLHLAASVQVRCVGIFGARNLPGRWYPYGSRHRVLSRKVPCAGCELSVCTQFQKRCIMGIGIDEVADAVVDQVNARTAERPLPAH